MKISSTRTVFHGGDDWTISIWKYYLIPGSLFEILQTLQNFMYTMLRDNNPVAAKKSLDVMIELYRKNIWKDAKTVNVIKTACLSPTTKVRWQSHPWQSKRAKADPWDQIYCPPYGLRCLLWKEFIGRKTSENKLSWLGANSPPTLGRCLPWIAVHFDNVSCIIIIITFDK